MNSVHPGSKAAADAGTPKRAPDERFSQIIREARHYYGFSLREAAFRTGCSEPTLYSLENEIRANPTIKTLSSIADGYGLCLGYLAEAAADAFWSSPDAGDAKQSSTTDDSRAPGMNPQPAIAKAQGTDQ